MHRPLTLAEITPREESARILPAVANNSYLVEAMLQSAQEVTKHIQAT